MPEAAPDRLRSALEAALDYVEQGATTDEATERVVAEFADRNATRGAHRA